jgi:tetratricopeptide (TPR) repeat protein
MADERRLALEQGDEGMLMRLNVFGGELAAYQGRWTEAARLYDAALRDADGYWRSFTLTHRAVLRARQGDQAAFRDASEVLESPTGLSDKILAAAAEFAIGLLEFAAGRIDEAARRVVGLSPTSDEGGSRAAEFAVFGPEAVAILVEAGRIDEAKAIVERLERRRVQLEPWVDGALDLGRGYILLAKADAREALMRFRSAADQFESLGSSWEHGRSRLGEGIALRRLGRRREAAQALERAIQVFEALSACAESVPCERGASPCPAPATPR